MTNCRLPHEAILVNDRSVSKRGTLFCSEWEPDGTFLGEMGMSRHGYGLSYGFGCGLVLLAALHFAAAPAATAEEWAAMGDSLTDEYLSTGGSITETDLPALSWVQVLAIHRGVDFGILYDAPPELPEPRTLGYERNWARAGGVANEIPGFFPPGTNIPAQAAGLATQIVPHGVDIVSINIGHNDYYFRDLLGGGLVSGISPELFVLDDPDYLAFEDGVFDQIFAGIDTVRAANPAAPPKFVVASMPKDSLEGVTYLPPALAQLDARVEAEVAARAAAGQEIKMVDMWGFEDERYDESGNLQIGPFIIPAGSKATYDQTVGPRIAEPGAPVDSARHFSTLECTGNLGCHDTPGGHPGTILQGLIANEILKVVNPWLTTPIALLTDTEIILAGAPGSCPDDDADTICDWDDLGPGIANAGGDNSDSNGDGIANVCQCGDVTGDGISDVSDSGFIQRAALSLPNPPFVDLALCDVDGNGLCDVSDSGFIQRRALGLSNPPFVREVCDVMP